MESFLPPDLGTSVQALRTTSENEPKWVANDLDAVMARAKTENKRVFIDFTGYTCTNCRWMEANIFTKKEVEDELKNFLLVQLYTDGEGDVYERQQQREQDMFGTVALPYYAVVDGNGNVKGSFPGLTRNVAEFVDFLKKAQQN